MSLQNIFIFLMLAGIFMSLGSALVYMVLDRGQGTRTVRALTWRVSISFVLLSLLALGYATGLLQRGGT